MQIHLVLKSFRFLTFALAIAVLSAVSIFAQQAKQQHSQFDVTNYKIEAQLVPAGNQLKATVDVSFTPLEDVRSIAFELNGSLKIESITRERTALTNVLPIAPPMQTGKTTKPITAVKTANAQLPAINFLQDQVGVGDIGPSVKIDLGETVMRGTPVILRFKYEGNLVTPDGGPLATKKLAFIGEQGSYLFYASRWFPFHDYAADRATSDVTIIAPSGQTIIGFSDAAVSQTNSGGTTRAHFVQNKPGLIGNFAAGNYITKTLRYSNFEVNFYTRAGSDRQIPLYGEAIGEALQYYTNQFGQADNGNKISVVQIDDESLDAYSGVGVMFLASKFFDEARPLTAEKLQREVAYQWWGQTVGLKSFDDAWLSQGLAEYSSVALRETKLRGAALESLNRELLEKALTFESQASLVRAPQTLDDQSTAYQYIMFGKGATVYRLLRDTLGAEKFNRLLREFMNQYRDKNASIDDFEKLSSQIAGNNLRYFFARWVEGTGVPEFTTDYQILRTKTGKFIARGTVKQNYDNLRLPVEVMLRSEGENQGQTAKLQIDEASEDFNLESNGKPLEVVIDPNFKLLRISDDLRVSSIARRGIEQYKDGNFAEAQQQFEAALKLDRSNSWVYYNLGLLFLEQRNYDLAVENFKAVLGGNLRPQWLQTWANIKMGNAYDAKGDRTRAVAAYKRAQDTGENYDDAQEAVKKYLATAFDPKEKNNTAVK